MSSAHQRGNRLLVSKDECKGKLQERQGQDYWQDSRVLCSSSWSAWVEANMIWSNVTSQLCGSGHLPFWFSSRFYSQLLLHQDWRSTNKTAHSPAPRHRLTRLRHLLTRRWTLHSSAYCMTAMKTIPVSAQLSEPRFAASLQANYGGKLSD